MQIWEHEYNFAASTEYTARRRLRLRQVANICIASKMNNKLFDTQ